MTKRLSLKNVYINESKHGLYGSVMLNDQWVPVRLVNDRFTQDKGYHEIVADNIWLDKRNPEKLVYRAKGNIVVIRQKSRTLDDLVEEAE